ncbi:MAG: glycosyl hydrolase, partial [Pseudomonadota bacterium]
DGGQNWRRIDRLPGVPQRFFVNDIKADLRDPDTVYVVVDDHKNGDFSPYILKSENRGRSWKSISSNLPERHILWRVVQDHAKPELLFLGTEFGVFFTVDAGGSWTKLKGGAPNIPFRDLVIQTRENDLVGATFGRSFYVFDDYTPLRSVTEELLTEGKLLFPVREAKWYVPKRLLGCGEPGCQASQGDGYYVADNPPFGAVFTYYLAEGLKSAKDMRREGEKELEKENEDVAFPEWSTILEEQREDPPAIVFTVRNSGGDIVRQIEAPAESGFHRVAWDLRYPALQPWAPGSEGSFFGNGGVLVAPGTFSVTMQERVDGVLSDVAPAQTFQVTSVRPEPVLPGSTQEQRVVFEMQADELIRAGDGTVAAIDEILEELDAVKETLARATTDGSLYEIANSIGQRLLEQRDRLSDNDTRSGFKEVGEMTLGARLWHARFTPTGGAYGPTPAQRESLRLARELYDNTVANLSTLEREYAALKAAMDTAKVPWTPGRGIQP